LLQMQLQQQQQQVQGQYPAPTNSQTPLYDYYLDLITPSSAPLTPNPSPSSPQISPPVYPSIELDAQTESNHDTALTLACAGGHAELVSLLLSRGAAIEHRDKKGLLPSYLNLSSNILLQVSLRSSWLPPLVILRW
jgi:ankyrin repeat protein